MDRRQFLAASVPALAALAGCTSDGGGDTPTGTDTPTDTPAGTDTPAETDTPAGTDTPTDTSAETDAPTDTASATETATPVQNPDQRVVVAPDGKLRFDPESFTIPVGGTVLWEWDGAGHNVSPTEGEIPAESDWSGDDETTYGSGHLYSYTFEVAGTYDYHCDPHSSSGMTGSFTVE